MLKCGRDIEHRVSAFKQIAKTRCWEVREVYQSALGSCSLSVPVACLFGDNSNPNPGQVMPLERRGHPKALPAQRLDIAVLNHQWSRDRRRLTEPPGWQQQGRTS